MSAWAAAGRYPDVLQHTVTPLVVLASRLAFANLKLAVLDVIDFTRQRRSEKTRRILGVRITCAGFASLLAILQQQEDQTLHGTYLSGTKAFLYTLDAAHFSV